MAPAWLLLLETDVLCEFETALPPEDAPPMPATLVEAEAVELVDDRDELLEVEEALGLDEEDEMVELEVAVAEVGELELRQLVDPDCTV